MDFITDNLKSAQQRTNLKNERHIRKSICSEYIFNSENDSVKTTVIGNYSNGEKDEQDIYICKLIK